MVVHDLRVVAGHCSRYYVVQDIGKGEGQIMGLALPQHLGEVALGVHIQQQDFLPLQREAGPQVVDGGAFADAALLICYADYLWFRHFGVPSFHRFSRLRRNRRLCKCMKKPPSPFGKDGLSSREICDLENNSKSGAKPYVRISLCFVASKFIP